MRLSNKVAVVTGAASGIGQGITSLFAEHGARVIMLDRDQEANEAAARSIGDLVRPVSCDVCSSIDVTRGVMQAMELFGRIDILVNNAGIYPRQSFLAMSEQQWDEVYNVNLKSMFHTCKAVMPHMASERSGKIVNISSVAFHIGMAQLSHYVTAKAGVIGFTRSLAREMGEQGVFVNCITPGAVLVEAERKVATEEQVRAIVDLQSLKRRILPVDIARVCLFLSSELSDGMTGQCLNVDGGWVMY